METKNGKPLPELYMLLGNIFLKPLDLAVFNLIPLQCTHIFIRIRLFVEMF